MQTGPPTCLLVGLGSALGASSAPGLPDHSVQYYYDANTLGGATGVSIDGTGSALQLGTGTFATVGLVRLPYNTGTVVAVRDGAGPTALSSRPARN